MARTVQQHLPDGTVREVRSLTEALAGYPRTVMPRLVLTCERCAHQDHKRCQGTPDLGTCRCKQCFTQDAMAMARTALAGNSLAAMRTALEAVYALQFQTMTQRQRKAQRPPRIARCDACGATVAVRRRPPPGQAVYCRGRSRCRMRAHRRRQRVTVTPTQIPQAPARSASEPAAPRPEATSSPAALWLAMRTG